MWMEINVAIMFFFCLLHILQHLTTSSWKHTVTRSDFSWKQAGPSLGRQVTVHSVGIIQTEHKTQILCSWRWKASQWKNLNQPGVPSLSIYLSPKLDLISKTRNNSFSNIQSHSAPTSSCPGDRRSQWCDFQRLFPKIYPPIGFISNPNW